MLEYWRIENGVTRYPVTYPLNGRHSPWYSARMKQLFRADENTTRVAVTRDGRLWALAAVHDQPLFPGRILACGVAQRLLVQAEYRALSPGSERL